MKSDTPPMVSRSGTDRVSAGRPDTEQLYATYRDAVCRRLARMVGEEQAEDLTQEVFAKVARALPDFRGESSVQTWLFRIATRTALDYLRSRAHGEKRRTDSLMAQNPADSQEACAHVGSLSEPAEAPGRVVRDEMNSCVRQYVQRLPDDQRTVIELKELEGLTNAEIATRLGITIATTKIRLHRARNALRELLDAGCEFYRTEENALACDRKRPGDG